MKINLRKTNVDDLARMIYEKNGSTGPNYIMLDQDTKLCVCGHGPTGHYHMWLSTMKGVELAYGKQEVLKYLKQNNLEIIL